MSLNLAMVVTENARRIPDKTALICNQRRLTYRQLDQDINRLANALQHLGVQRDDAVTMMLPNVPEFVVAYFAIVKLGAICVPINPLYKRREIEFLLGDSQSAAFICFEASLAESQFAFDAVETCRHLIVTRFSTESVAKVSTDSLAADTYDYAALLARFDCVFDMAMTEADDTAVLVYTSGTTGKPKGAMLTHFNLFYQAFVLPFVHWQALSECEVSLAVLPLFHCFGQSCVMNARLARGSIVSLMPTYDPQQVLEVIQRDRVTHFAGVPTMYLQMLNHLELHKYDLSTLQDCVSGGAPMPLDTLQRWKKTFGLEIREGYGLTETSPVATFNFPCKETVYGSCGEPIWGCDIKIVDPQGKTLPPGQDGEVVIRGVNIMKGYYRNPESTAAVLKDGWFATGDQGRMDDKGYLYIVGRIKDMILRGGFNVYPREIEELLFEHTAVHECAVFGIPDHEMGEEIKAAVFLKPGSSATSDELKQFCKERIAPYKYPRIVEILPEPLPKGPSGKILKRELLQMHLDSQRSS